MSQTFSQRLQHAWNAFSTTNDPLVYNQDLGISYGYRPDRMRMVAGNERSIVASIYNRISIDVAATTIQHVRKDQNERYVETINSGLNRCLTVEANVDQSARAFIQEAVMSLFDEGVVAIIPVDTTLNPAISGSYDIRSLRTGQILEWYPRHVRVRVYNDTTGKKEDLILPKSTIAIVDNPLYSVMNEPNSALKRLVQKINLLDVVDEQSSSGKLDLIIQLPYVIKSEARRDQADARRKDIEVQLSGSKYGIAYVDGTEKVTQLNRPVENTLLPQIAALTEQVHSQLGLTAAVFNGTADDKAMLNYYNRTIEPIVSALTGNMYRKFLTKTAQAQNQTIMAFKDPFRLVPVNDLAEIADKFTRNEILSANEIRAIIGYKPVSDPSADELRNKNLNATSEPPPEGEPITDPMEGNEDEV